MSDEGAGGFQRDVWKLLRNSPNAYQIGDDGGHPEYKTPF